jgi:hypothetical protein
MVFGFIRSSPFLRGSMKLSKDPVPSAKAASADEQINKVVIKALRHLPTIDNCLEGNLRFTTKHFYNAYPTYARQTYIYF